MARWRVLGRNEGVARMPTAERKAVVRGSPDLETLTTSHIERAFLTVRQAFSRLRLRTLPYSKDLGSAQGWPSRFTLAFTISSVSITRLELRQRWPQGWRKSLGV